MNQVDFTRRALAFRSVNVFYACMYVMCLYTESAVAYSTFYQFSVCFI